MSQSRMTKQRAVILEALKSATSHPTADEIYGIVRKKLPRISLGTVYRNLELLSSCGEILRLDRAGVQKRFDGNTHPHLHVRCEICGKVADVHMPPPSGVFPGTVPGFSVHSVEVEFIGICDGCEQMQN